MSPSPLIARAPTPGSVKTRSDATVNSPPSSSFPTGRSRNTTARRPAVLTAPPWAEHEPPSPPDERPNPFNTGAPASAVVPSATATHAPSFRSSSDTSSHMPDGPASRWWSFGRPRPRDMQDPGEKPGETGVPLGLRTSTMRERMHSSWLYDLVGQTKELREREKTIPEDEPRSSHSLDVPHGEALQFYPQSETEAGPSSPVKSHTKRSASTSNSGFNRPSSSAMHLDLPTPTANPFGLSRTRTHGWDSPWVPHSRKLPPVDQHGYDGENGGLLYPTSSHSTSSESRGPWARRKKAFRTFLLHSNYVPLILRFSNLSFTAAGLAIAVRIHRTEMANHVRGSIGSSPMLVIFFAPLTLVHVMSAIYLEYFGRPLGLWKTSAKLTHTLSEVVFICAWSAALSLCFDNYLTTPLNCTPPTATDWYSELGPEPSPSGVQFSPALVKNLCAKQRDLISLVFVGLVFYCGNLVISLFRIFEKVKYHRGQGIV